MIRQARKLREHVHVRNRVQIIRDERRDGSRAVFGRHDDRPKNAVLYGDILCLVPRAAYHASSGPT